MKKQIFKQAHFKQEMDVVENVLKHFQKIIKPAYVKYQKMWEKGNYQKVAVNFAVVLAVVHKIKSMKIRVNLTNHVK